MTAKFKHDCDRCMFLGHFGGYDVYRCNQKVLGVTYLARCSDDPGDYSSYPKEIFERILQAGVKCGDESMSFEQFTVSHPESPMAAIKTGVDRHAEFEKVIQAVYDHFGYAMRGA